MIEWILSCCVMIGVIALLRFFFRGRINARLQYALWALVLIRLLVPVNLFSTPSSISGLVNEVRQQPTILSAEAVLEKPIITYHQAAQQVAQLSSGTALEQHDQVRLLLRLSTPAFVLETVLPWIWYTGMAVTALCYWISNLRFARRLKKSRTALDIPGSKIPVYCCEGLVTPCLFGVFHPAVYLTPEDARDPVRAGHIIAHETTHFRHLDHLWANLRCVCIVLHWYNPLVWLAAGLSRRDAELACDEAAIQRLGEDQRVAYGRTLIEVTCSGSAGSGLLDSATTMAYSSKAIKERIAMIAKKPKATVLALAAVLLVTVICAAFTLSESNIIRPGADEGAFETETISVDPSKLPVLDKSKKEEILSFWKEYYLPDDEQYINTFSSPGSKKEGIRYYGTYYHAGSKTSYEILFISDNAWATPCERTIGTHVFRHKSSFGLYAYQYLENSKLGLFTPLQSGFFGNDESFTESIAAIHNTYEQTIYGSVITRLHPQDETTEEGRLTALKRAWFNKHGHIPSFTKKGDLRYYGRFDGYDIIFQESMLTAIGSETIAGYTFNSNNLFTLYAYKDGDFQMLKDVYNNGGISKGSIQAIWEIHPGIILGE